jgi:hypothetical protein
MCKCKVPTTEIMVLALVFNHYLIMLDKAKSLKFTRLQQTVLDKVCHYLNI